MKLETFDLLLWALGLIVLPEGEMVNFPGNVSCGTVAEVRALACFLEAVRCGNLRQASHILSTGLL